MLILVRPHVSLLDGLFVAWKLREVPALFPVDSDYARHPLWGRILRAYGRLLGHRMVALDVERPMGIRTVLQALQEGRNVVLFPQGVGLSDPGRPDRPGAQWLLRKSPFLAAHYELVHWHGIPVRLLAYRSPESPQVFAIPEQQRKPGSSDACQYRNEAS